MIEASKCVAIKVERRHLHDFWGQHRSMCTHSIDDLLPHAPLHYAATGDMVKCSHNKQCGSAPANAICSYSHFAEF